VLTEGFDATIADTCIVARGCGSQGLWVQMVGRVLRPHVDADGVVKDRATLLDLRGLVNGDLGRPDADREYSLDGQGIRLVGQEASAHRFCSCGAILDDVPPGGPCPECGKEKVIHRCEVTGDEISEWKASIRRDDDAMRAYRLSKWVADLEMRNKQPRSAWHKYKAVYGEYPSREVLALTTAASVDWWKRRAG